MTNNDKSSNRCKDTMGNAIHVGDWVSILPPPNTIWVGRITEVSDGGLSLSIDRNQKGVTPSKVRLVLDITLQANPQVPVFPNLVRIVTPMEEAAVEKILEKIETPPIQ